MTAPLRWPRREHIRPTHETDPLHFYYRWGIRGVFRKRLAMVVELLGDRRYDGPLEVGFGSGIFLPELAARCRRLYGVDVHGNFDLVEAMLGQEGIQATLVDCPVQKIAFEAGRFACVVWGGPPAGVPPRPSGGPSGPRPPGSCSSSTPSSSAGSAGGSAGSPRTRSSTCASSSTCWTARDRCSTSGSESRPTRVRCGAPCSPPPG